MDFAAVAETLGKLEETSSRLELTKIVKELLLKSGSDLGIVILFVRGKAFPTWDTREMGIAQKSMIKSIATATGLSANKVEDKIAELGDTGLAAEALFAKKIQTTLDRRTMSLKEIHSQLEKLASMEGTGSQDRKNKYVVELLNSVGPDEVKYLVRLMLGEMRIGVGEGIVRDAIAGAFDVPPEEAERAFSLINDYGEVGEIARDSGVKGLQKIDIKLFRPLRPMLAQSVSSVDEAFKSDCHAFEFKYDGMRCISGHTPIYVRDKGLLSVKDVKKGDYVLTHKGTFKRVIATNKRLVDKGERVFRLQTFLGNEFKITEGHRLFVHDGKNSKWMPIEDITKNHTLVFPVPKVKMKKAPKELTLKTPDNYEKTFRLSDNFFRFLGYWIGDGFSNNYNKTFRVGVIFNKKDTKLLKFYRNIVEKEFNVGKISTHTHQGAIYLYWTDRPFMLWLSKNFRNQTKKRGWRGKALPEWFWGISKLQFEQFLKGWIEADGHSDPYGGTSITTKERGLAAFAQLLALKFGIIIGTKKIRVGKTTYYKLVIPKTNRAAKIKNNKLLVKILHLNELKRVDPRLYVYNLQVEDDESYCSTLLSLHNCQIHIQGDRIKIFTRRLEDVTTQFPDVVDAVRKGTSIQEAIIEGETVAVDENERPKPFQLLSRRIKRKYELKKMVNEIPVVTYLFDCMYLNGKNLVDEPLTKRRKTLEKIVMPNKMLKFSKTVVTDKTKQAEKFYKEALKLGHEGVMAKNLDAVYKPGSRVGYMYKLKPITETLDLAIVGAEWGEGRRAKWLGSYLLACRDPDTNEFLEIGRMGTGMSDEQLQQLTDTFKEDVEYQKGKFVKLRPHIVVEAGYQDIQKSPTYKSGYALRFPKLIRIREDRDPEECDTLDRVASLYELFTAKK